MSGNEERKNPRRFQLCAVAGGLKQARRCDESDHTAANQNIQTEVERMATPNNNTPNDTPQAVRNEFQTFMTLREKGVNKDTALRAADHMRRATNEGGEKGAMTAAAQILVWIGAGLLVIVLAIGLAQYANAAAPAKPATANIIGLPVVSSNCRIKCTSSVPYPTPTATPFVNEPPMPTAPVVSVEAQ